jgi:esterase/lipase superfamily enzyme
MRPAGATAVPVAGGAPAGSAPATRRPCILSIVGARPEIIQAAPDVDAEVFTQAVGNLRANGAKLTLYAASNDKALWLSGLLRKGLRAGFIAKNKPLIIEGVDTIDITQAGTGLFGLNHDIYLSSPTVIADMRRIFETGHRPPDQRTRELEPVATENGRYWRLRSVN